MIKLVLYRITDKIEEFLWKISDTKQAYKYNYHIIEKGSGHISDKTEDFV